MQQNEMQSTTPPLVSAIITLYNKELWIERAVRSVLKQTEKNFELIVVDDGCTDSSVAKVLQFTDPRIKLVSKKNGGLPAARNTGIGVAKGSYIAFLDADDEWLPWHLESALAGFRQHPQAAVVANRYKQVFPQDPAQGEEYGVVPAQKVSVERIDSLLENLSRGRFVFHVISALISKEAMLGTGTFFEEKLEIGEDLNFFIRMSLVGEIFLTNSISTIYHRCDNNSMMNLTGVKPQVTPRFFRGVCVEALSASNLRSSRRFLLKEYLKRAYQNRGLAFSYDEVALPVAEIPPSRYWKLCYLLLRFSPAVVMRMIVGCKKLMEAA